MAAVIVDPSKVHEYPDAKAFYTWLGHHHAKQTEVWIKIHKLASGLGRVIAHFLPAKACSAVQCKAP